MKKLCFGRFLKEKLTKSNTCGIIQAHLENRGPKTEGLKGLNIL